MNKVFFQLFVVGQFLNLDSKPKTEASFLCKLSNEQVIRYHGLKLYKKKLPPGFPLCSVVSDGMWVGGCDNNDGRDSLELIISDAPSLVSNIQFLGTFWLLVGRRALCI